MKEQLQRLSLQEELKLFVLECFWHVNFCCSREFNPNFIPEFIFLLEQEGLEQRQKELRTPFVVVLGV